MRLQIRQHQPNRFENRITFNKKSIKIDCDKQKIILGRNQKKNQPSQEYNFIQFNHKSISRKHAQILLPPFISLKSRNLAAKTMQMRGNILIPKYFFKFGGIWKKLPHQIIVKIRQYCSPLRCLVIKDLNSKYRVFKQIKNLELKVQVEQKLIQFGNQNVFINQVRLDNNFKEIQSYKQQKLKQIDHICWIQPPERVIDNKFDLYSSIILRQEHLNEENHQKKYYGIIVKRKEEKISNKVTIGRHSLNNLQINRPSISRKQASVYVNEKGKWIIKDQNSTNKTWLKLHKIICPINNLILKQEFIAESLTQTELLLENFQRRQKYRPLTIKLGEVMIDIQILNMNERQEKCSNFKGAQTSYEKILIDLQ